MCNSSPASDTGVEHRFANYLRIWPVGTCGGTSSFAGFSAAKARPWGTGVPRVYELSGGGGKYALLADLSDLAARGLDTTGQPLRYGKEIFLPMWSTEFYTEGVLGLAIVSCNTESSGRSEIRYINDFNTYGCHFFCNESRPNEIFLGVGKGGGGKHGRIKYAPASGMLLKSEDRGRNWRSVFASQKASAMYDGLATNDVVVMSSREQRAIVVLKEDRDGSYSLRNTYSLESTPRNVSILTWKNSTIVVVSSNDGFYTATLDAESGDLEIHRVRMPVRGFALRYPTVIGGDFLSFIGDSSPLSRSWLLLHASGESFYVDLTRLTGMQTFTRMVSWKSSEGEKILLGTEMEGCLRLYDADWLLRQRKKLDNSVRLETTVKSLWSSGREHAVEMLGGSVRK